MDSFVISPQEPVLVRECEGLGDIYLDTPFIQSYDTQTFLSKKYNFCLCRGFTAQSTARGHAEQGQFPNHFYWAGLVL